MKSPDVFEFLNIHHFLQEIYRHRKLTEKNFSYQSWAEEMKVKDRSYLRQLVQGQRAINKDFLERLVCGFKFTKSEEAYFRLLLEYSYSEDPRVRDELGKKLVELIKNKLATVES